MNRSCLFLFLAMGLLGQIVPMQRASAKPQKKTTRASYKQLEVLAQVLHFVDTSYLNRGTSSSWIEFAIGGVLDGLDRHSRFFTKEELQREELRGRQKRFGIGLEWEFEDQACLVRKVRSGSAAAKAGIQVGEEIVKVNGLNPIALGRDGFESFMAERSQKWTRMELRTGSVPDAEPSLKRPRKIRVPPPELEFIEITALQDKVTLLRIGRFFAGSAEFVRQELSRRARPVQHLIVDLRGNTGGVVEEAVRIADIWLDEGLISVMIDANRHREERLAHGGGVATKYPIVVLIDGSTASAAEVLAAALSQNQRARLVGTQSYGKSTVQTLIRFTNGSALRLTVGRLFGPGGRSWRGLGLSPALLIVPGLTAAGRDRQLVGAIQAVLYPE